MSGVVRISNANRHIPCHHSASTWALLPLARQYSSHPAVLTMAEPSITQTEPTHIPHDQPIARDFFSLHAHGVVSEPEPEYEEDNDIYRGEPPSPPRSPPPESVSTTTSSSSSSSSSSSDSDHAVSVTRAQGSTGFNYSHARNSEYTATIYVNGVPFQVRVRYSRPHGFRFGAR